MPALILYGDTEHSASMRHEVPISIGDPFLVVVEGERTWISCSSLERERLVACRPDAELLDYEGGCERLTEFPYQIVQE